MGPRSKNLFSFESANMFAVVFVALLMGWSAQARAAIVLLQNDSFQSGDQAAFQNGFVSGEMAGVTLGPLNDACQVLDIQLLFGGDTSQRTVTLHIYQDNGATDPGPEVFSGDFQLTGSNENFVQIDLSGENILIGAGVAFRVAIEFQHDGVPSVARDADGINPGKNWIFASGLGWVDSQTYLISGDWVIRAEVNTLTGQPDAGVEPDASQQQDGSVAQDGQAAQDAAVTGDGAAVQDGTTGQDGSSPSGCVDSEDCSGGQVCYGGSCVTVCTSDGDCSGGYRCHHGLCKLTCSSSSQCSGGQICADEVCQTACVGNADCQGGEVCRDSVCRTSCTTDGQCSGGETCQGNVCLPGTQSSSDDSGCGCATDAAAGTGFIVFLMLILLGVLVRSGRSRD